MLRAQHLHPATEYLGSTVFGDLMREYERRVFEATVMSSVKATSATARVHANLVGVGAGVGARAGTGVKGECK